MSNVVIRSRFSPKESVYHPFVSGVARVYEERILEDKTLGLVQVGITDIGKFVQSSLDATKIYNILDRFNSGQVEALQKVKGFFADVTGLPSNLAEAHNLMLGIEKQFSSLDPTIRNKFDNNVAKFAEKMFDGSAGEIFKELSFKVNNTAVQKSDVKEDNVNVQKS